MYNRVIFLDENKVEASMEVKSVRENIINAFKQIAVRCNLSLYMVKGGIHQCAIDSVCMGKII